MLATYLMLCKPRVILLMLLTAWAGMYLAAKQPIPLSLWVNATIGIALMCGAAATANHIIDRHVDATMERTKHRPLPAHRLSVQAASIFALLQGITGWIILYHKVNPLCSYLTLSALFGYAGIYSLYLKKATSQNIVIGGLAGAVPPLLGWTAVANQLEAGGWLLVLIIFTWTPAHFWALCLNRYQEYQKTSIPMLPMTHNIAFTQLHILLYSILTVAASLLPYVIQMSGSVYLISVILLNIGWLFETIRLYLTHDMHQIQRVALKTFHYSLFYLTGLFMALLVDHYVLLT